MSDDNGRVIHSTVPHRGRRLQRPFFWKTAVYALSYSGYDVSTVKFSLDANGKATGFADLGKTPVARCWNLLATCVYRGQAYLFFDRQIDDVRWWYHIRYKVTSDPDHGWPGDGEGRDTGRTAEYANWGARPTPASLAAKELGDRLYLIYYREERLHWTVYDGKTWQDLGPMLAENYHPNFAVTDAMVDGKPVLVVAGRTHANEKLITVSIITTDRQIRTLPGTYMDWVAIDSVFSVVHGSIANDVQENVLHIFGNNSGTRPDLRRVTFSLDRMAGAGAWSDSTIDSVLESVPLWDKTETWPFCDALSVPIPTAPGSTDFRQHHVVLTKYEQASVNPMSAVSRDQPETQLVSVYASDLYRCENPDAPEVDTQLAETKEPHAWTLLGVIEGVPPFSRNGVASDDATSFVEYGRSNEHSVTVKQTFGTSISSSATLGSGDTVSITGQQASSFATAKAFTRDETSKVNITFSNKDLSADGVHGWLIVSKPRLQGRRYTRLSWDEKMALGTFYVVVVTGTAVVAERYRLDAPPAGMLPRARSSDLAAWQAVTIPTTYENIEPKEMNSLDATLTGSESVADLTFRETDERTTTGTTNVTIKAKVALSKLFNAELEAGFTFQQERSVTMTFAENITARLTLPNPHKPGQLKIVRLTVAPHWLLPAKGTHLDPGSFTDAKRRLYWLPDEARGNGIIPWCLTWKVTRVEQSEE